MTLTLRSVALGLAAILSPGAAADAQSSLPTGTPVSTSYVAQFAACDETDVFGQTPVTGRTPQGKKQGHGCKTDPSRFQKFDRIAAQGQRPEAIVLLSKLALDEDGSWNACHHAGGPTDDCKTSLKLIVGQHHPCELDPRLSHCVPVDPAEIPYVVIPAAVPKMPWLKADALRIDPDVFRRLSGVTFGDFGLVIFKGKTVPVVIADGGPAYKMGEGSIALLKALSTDGRPHPISSGVTVVLFPRTKLKPSELDSDGFAAVVTTRGRSCFALLTGAPSSTPCGQN